MLPGPPASEARCSLTRGALPAWSRCPPGLAAQGFPPSLLHFPSMEQVLGKHQLAQRGASPPLPRSAPPAGTGPEPARPNLSWEESTRTACTQTPNTLYTRDIPRKKHLIHPLNNSDNSILSPIYMFQTRYRCYENIANIQKYIHLKNKTI